MAIPRADLDALRRELTEAIRSQHTDLMLALQRLTERLDGLSSIAVANQERLMSHDAAIRTLRDDLVRCPQLWHERWAAATAKPADRLARDPHPQRLLDRGDLAHDVTLVVSTATATVTLGWGLLRLLGYL